MIRRSINLSIQSHQADGIICPSSPLPLSTYSIPHTQQHINIRSSIKQHKQSTTSSDHKRTASHLSRLWLSSKHVPKKEFKKQNNKHNVEQSFRFGIKCNYRLNCLIWWLLNSTNLWHNLFVNNHKRSDHLYSLSLCTFIYEDVIMNKMKT